VSGEAPVVSVVLPAYNAEATLLAAVESVLQQSLRDLSVSHTRGGCTIQGPEGRASYVPGTCWKSA
jgi:hypothetical protein